MKILIAGLGSVGRRHLRNLITLGEKDLVLYRTNLSTLPDDELSEFPVETDIHKALDKHKPDAVIIANPTSLHMDIAIPSAEAGCAIFLEKPISDHLDKVSILKNVSNKTNSPVLVGFQFRFHPTLNKAKELIASGALGNILTVHAHWGEYLPNWHPWEDYRQSYAARADLGGGVIVTLIHPLDYLRYMIGEINSLWSFSGHISPLELSAVEDVAEIGLKFSSGPIGGIHVNYFQRPPVHRLEIVGTAGTLRWDNADGILHHLNMPDTFGIISSQPAQANITQYHLPEGFDRNLLFLNEMQHFLNVARGKETPICTLHDGIRALELALMAKTSQQQ